MKYLIVFIIAALLFSCKFESEFKVYVSSTYEDSLAHGNSYSELFQNLKIGSSREQVQNYFAGNENITFNGSEFIYTVQDDKTLSDISWQVNEFYHNDSIRAIEFIAFENIFKNDFNKVYNTVKNLLESRLNNPNLVKNDSYYYLTGNIETQLKTNKGLTGRYISITYSDIAYLKHLQTNPGKVYYDSIYNTYDNSYLSKKNILSNSNKYAF